VTRPLARHLSTGDTLIRECVVANAESYYLVLILPQVRRGILDGSTSSRISVLADRGVYEPFFINAPRRVERRPLPLGFWRIYLLEYLSFWFPTRNRNSTGIPVPLPFFYVENLKGIPVPVKKTEGTGIPQVLLPLRTTT
jgi:hypothetical protein